MPDTHSRLAPSAAERWLHCPASVALSHGIEDEDSVFAKEGTWAHTLCELQATERILQGRAQQSTELVEAIKQIEAEGFDASRMMHAARRYVEILKATMQAMGPDTELFLEQHMSAGIPECEGTSDAVLVNSTHVHIVDLKYGMQEIDPENNPQLMLYGLGALDTFGDLLGDIETVTLSVFQPRIRGELVSWSLPAEELRQWRESIREPARKASEGVMEFGPSDKACHWCPVAGKCKPRMEFMVARDFGPPADTEAHELEPEDIARVLDLMPGVQKWFKDVEAEALKRAYDQGVPIPGRKVVLSGGKRQVSDPATAIQTLIDQGFSAEDVARFQIKPFRDLDNLGATAHIQGFITRTEGRPSLVPDTDGRPAVDKTAQAANDFA